MHHLRQLISQLTRQIRKLARQETYATQVSYLKSIPGIGPLTAMILLTEIVDINRFRNLDHLASYVGLIPGEDSSGDTEKTTGISYRRNGHLRALLVECSWVAVRKDPALMMWQVEQAHAQEPGYCAHCPEVTQSYTLCSQESGVL